jgi:hypothetical protein
MTRFKVFELFTADQIWIPNVRSMLRSRRAVQQFLINLFESRHVAAALAVGSWRILYSCSHCVQYFASQSYPAKGSACICGMLTASATAGSSPTINIYNSRLTDGFYHPCFSCWP